MREDLFGYLLGALEPHEAERVEAWLRDDPQAQTELELARNAIEAMSQSLDEDAPTGAELELPSGLTGQTLSAIFDDAIDSDRVDEKVCDQSHQGDQNSLVEASSSLPLEASLSPVNRRSGARSNVLNWLFAAGSIAAAVALVLPAVVRVREDSRRLACQDQMQQLGNAMVQFVNYSPQNRLPEIASQGTEAFAGMYAVRLADSGLLRDPSLRWCPSVGRPDTSDYRFSNPLRLASAEQLEVMDVNQLNEIQRSSGGHYAYSLGVLSKGEYQSPRYEGRASFAVLGESPSASFLKDGELQINAPHVDGVNLLYEDCSVRFVEYKTLDALPDHPFQNHRGANEAGVTIDDASLAPSWRPPFVDSPQR